MVVNKVVFVARNPKDVIVSYYFHHKHIKLQDVIDLKMWVIQWIKKIVLVQRLARLPPNQTIRVQTLVIDETLKAVHGNCKIM